MYFNFLCQMPNKPKISTFRYRFKSVLWAKVSHFPYDVLLYRDQVPQVNLTLFGMSLAAPALRSAWTTSQWPVNAATMSTVHPFWMGKGWGGASMRTFPLWWMQSTICRDSLKPDRLQKFSSVFPLKIWSSPYLVLDVDGGAGVKERLHHDEMTTFSS